MKKFAWEHKRRYNDFQTAFRRMMGGQKLQKISVNSGFSCPNRDGSKGTGGCTYCNNEAFNPCFSLTANSVTEQIRAGIRFFSRKNSEMQFLVYFQSFSNTYARLEELDLLYREALSFPGVKGAVIATRPDCISDEILDYLAGLAEKTYIMLELGIESHLNETLERINRCHTYEESTEGIRKAAERKIHTTAHMILGLPGENHHDWMEQAKAISCLPVENLKLHQLQIHAGTVMARQYAENPDQFHLFTVGEYSEVIADYLELLNPAITVERFTSQVPPGFLIAPSWGLKNYEFTAKIEKLLLERDTWQGRFYCGHP